ncbi:50S ribosomal protein L30 [bacterium]|nr:50S ribosomal protein L30 [bacterium]
MANRLKITLKKSPNGRIPKHTRILDALGLRKTNRTVCVPDNPQMQGMVRKITHLVSVERVEEKDA